MWKVETLSPVSTWYIFLTIKAHCISAQSASFSSFRSILYRSCAEPALTHCDLASTWAPDLAGRFCSRCLIRRDAAVFASSCRTAVTSTEIPVTEPPEFLTPGTLSEEKQAQLLPGETRNVNHRLCFPRTCFSSLIIKEMQVTLCTLHIADWALLCVLHSLVKQRGRKSNLIWDPAYLDWPFLSDPLWTVSD